MAGRYTLFVCGDVMTGRGLDQILAHPSHPKIFEPFMSDARDYVRLAEQANGDIPRCVSADYIWGEAIPIWRQRKPAVKIVNLETAITRSDDYWQGKGINYRMHPENIDVLSAAGIDIATLANNHLLDWGVSGLQETLSVLRLAHIGVAGAGENLEQAMQPAVFKLSTQSRVLVFAMGVESSGILPSWAADQQRPGVFWLKDLSDHTVNNVVSLIDHYRQPGDLVIISIHWGSNWGYEIPIEHREFAHQLIDRHIDLIFGHSSHHPRPIEIYRGKPILYGCGDFINDYEGISGHESFRGDLSLMYFLEFDTETLRFTGLELVPLQIKNFSLHRAGNTDTQWLFHTLSRESSQFKHTHFDLSPMNTLLVN